MAPTYPSSTFPSFQELHLGPWDYIPFPDHNELECFLKQVQVLNQRYLASTSTIPLKCHSVGLQQPKCPIQGHSVFPLWDISVAV